MAPTAPPAVDYPDYGAATCDAVVNGSAAISPSFCGTGVGISDGRQQGQGHPRLLLLRQLQREYTRRHNDANALCMGGRVVGPGLACQLVDIFLNTEFEGGRHEKRIAKMMAMETLCSPLLYPPWDQLYIVSDKLLYLRSVYL